MEAEQNMRIKEQEHQQSLVHEQQKHQLDMQTQAQASDLKMRELAASHEQQMQIQKHKAQTETTARQEKAAEPKAPPININIDGFKDVAKAMTAPKRLVKGKDGSKTIETVG